MVSLGHNELIFRLIHGFVPQTAARHHIGGLAHDYGNSLTSENALFSSCPPPTNSREELSVLTSEFSRKLTTWLIAFLAHNHHSKISVKLTPLSKTFWATHQSHLSSYYIHINFKKNHPFWKIHISRVGKGVDEGFYWMICLEQYLLMIL